jgi:hypothetical protein
LILSGQQDVVRQVDSGVEDQVWRKKGAAQLGKYDFPQVGRLW